MTVPWWVSWVTATGTIGCAYFTRKLKWWGFLIGLLNQVFWWWITVATAQWGFIPINLFMTYNYARGMVEWRRRGLRAGR